MQFVENGPDVPERLLQAHEEGRVVFFCGAGISYPAGLPGFAGLVSRIYERLHVHPSAVQKAAIKAKQFDTAIGLLETHLVGGRELVRRELGKILVPDLGKPRAADTHEALITLAKARNGRTRLVTTNFDRLFEEVINRKRLSLKTYQAPLLPVPKNRWDGVVYLHGLLSHTPTFIELDQLVLASGDFGLAYLTERWAARFVGELFRNYTVCFVGYSISDPVLRYMMDALAADRLLGESPPEMFAFGGFSKGQEARSADEWVSKNVTPILYREWRSHCYLHNTLRAWAATYRDGVLGKERIVVECAIARPLTSTQQDDFVGRLVWALSDTTGLPAKRFAELNPVPSLEWLGPFSETRFGHIDLVRFGVAQKADLDEELKFSLIDRPSPYDLAPRMVLVDIGWHGRRWDKVMRQLARWLIRHLNDPNLLLWLVNRGGQLHQELAEEVSQQLGKLGAIERQGNVRELYKIRASAQNAVPEPPMRILWQLLLSGRIRSTVQSNDLFDWRAQFQREGMTTWQRMKLREALTPRIRLREPFRRNEIDETRQSPLLIRDIVNWEIVLSADYVKSTIRELNQNQQWNQSISDLLPDFSMLLRDALDLMRELGGADEKSDRSYMQQPSISDHAQNRDFHDWTALIDLTRDAWLATAANSPEFAFSVAQDWQQVHYPLFRRLSFFAAAKHQIISSNLALRWLLADNNWWLWSTETMRETMRLIVAIAPRLQAHEVGQLEEAILAGPPREMFSQDVEAEDLMRVNERSIWLRLAKLANAVGNLGEDARNRLNALSTKYPLWMIAEDERDEFPFWMGVGEEWREFVATPRRRRDLVEWLRQNPTTDTWREDDWRQRCREDFATTSLALFSLARENIWPTDRWREALQAWSEELLLRRSWRHMARVLESAPDNVLQELAYGVSWWLKAVAKSFEGQDALFFRLCKRILAYEYVAEDEDDDPVNRAINHPVGHITGALLHWWDRRPLEDEQGLPEDLHNIFSALCDPQIEKYRHARIVLASHIISLFRVDRNWTKKNLIPLFDWQHMREEARAAWQSFLWTARLYRPLIGEIKVNFLETAQHYDELGELNEQYATLLTFAALDPGDTFSLKQLATATRALPQHGLRDAAQTLVRALESAGDQRAEYWKNRVLPYLQSIWPKSREIVTQEISESLAMLCIASQESFPEALQTLRHWLQPPRYSDYVVHNLEEANICGKFPAEALEFLGLVVGDDGARAPGDLQSCLEAIRAAAPELQLTQTFLRLVQLLRQGGGELS